MYVYNNKYMLAGCLVFIMPVHAVIYVRMQLKRQPVADALLIYVLNYKI